jgi:hypothetical protein
MAFWQALKVAFDGLQIRHRFHSEVLLWLLLLKYVRGAQLHNVCIHDDDYG